MKITDNYKIYFRIEIRGFVTSLKIKLITNNMNYTYDDCSTF